MPPTDRPADGPSALADVAEAELLARLRAGDRAAFSALVARHGGPLLRLATALVKDRPLAEEVVQDAWLAALEGLDGFEGRAALRTWLFRIVVNRARTRLAREGRSVPFSSLEEADRRGGTGGADGGEPAVPGDRFDGGGHWRLPPAAWTVEDPERLAEAAQTRRLLEGAIADLPEAMRAVIVLRDVEGLETEEICNLLGVTVSNQRVLLHRARARVRAALEAVLERAR